MILYRSVNKQNTEDFSATYTASVNGELQKGSCRRGLASNSSFNGNVIIGNNVWDCSGLFISCSNFNQPINIPNSVKNCTSMFSSCNNFNQPIDIPNSVRCCNYMFFNCANFNQPVNISQNVEACYSMFQYSGFNQDLVIPKSVNEIGFMLYTNSYGKNVYIQGNEYRSLHIAYMFSQNNVLRKNIFFNQALNNIFNITNSYSLVGASITWTPMTNGFYNEYYNIYCYYNYSG